jgi:mutator family transposase
VQAPYGLGIRSQGIGADFNGDMIQRRESSVEEALIEMYVAGVPVGRVEDITQVLWGTRASPSNRTEFHNAHHLQQKFPRQNFESDSAWIRALRNEITSVLLPAVRLFDRSIESIIDGDIVWATKRLGGTMPASTRSKPRGSRGNRRMWHNRSDRPKEGETADRTAQPSHGGSTSPV